jgi:hypothetical protein
MRVVRTLNIYKQRLILLTARIEALRGARWALDIESGEATQAEIASLLDEGDRYLADLRARWGTRRN